MTTERNPIEPDELAVSSRREGTRVVVALVGELDLHGSDKLTAEIHSVLGDNSEGLERLELDAGQLTFADSAGLRAVLMARAAAEASGVPFSVSAVSASVERVIEMAGLTDLLLSQD